jgi:hypothetical protein
MICDIQDIKDVDFKGIAILANSQYEFRLGGSRFFGNYKVDSDYDFFIQTSDEVKTFLRNNEFKNNADNVDYYDVNTESTFKYGKTTAILVFSLEKRIRAHDYLIKNFNGISPKNDVKFWDCIYEKIANEENEQRTDI